MTELKEATKSDPSRHSSGSALNCFVMPDAGEIAALMKRCQVGCGGRGALDNAHSILADCYGTIGFLDSEVKRLKQLMNDMAKYYWFLRNGHCIHVDEESDDDGLMECYLDAADQTCDAIRNEA